MTIDKAIEILSQQLYRPACAYNYELSDATKLGIEALKAIKCGREGLRTEFVTPLIGETQD